MNFRLLNELALLALVLFALFLAIDSRLRLVTPVALQVPTALSVLPTVTATAVITHSPTTTPRPTNTPFVRPTQVPTNTLSIPWGPVVAFIFDDTNDTAYSLAYPLLQRYGLRAGVVAISDLVGEDKRLSWPQIEALDRAGWDIIAGTTSHPDTTKIGETQLEQELRQNRLDIEAHIGAGRVAGLVWPDGDAGPREWSIARQLFDWSASGADALNGDFLLRHGLPDTQPWWRYRLAGGVVASAYGRNGDITAAVQPVIDGPQAWLIDFERVSTQAATNDDITVSDVQAVIDYLLANHATIVTPGEFYRILRYGKPDCFRPGVELIRNSTFTLESQERGLPSSFQIRNGVPQWHSSGGPAGIGYVEVTQEASFETVALPVEPGHKYRFSLMRNAAGASNPPIVVGVEFRDINSQALSTLQLPVPAATDWAQASVEFTVPEKADSAHLFVAPQGAGSILTTGWSLVEQ